ncbi:MAG: arginine--tRNA ligase [bacterium]|nr:arginine--tRNA ligase [bacterium]
MTPRDTIRAAIQRSLKSLGAGDVSFSVEKTEKPEHGDYATNASLLATKWLKKNPMEIAELVKENLGKDKELGDYIERIETAKPGFVNFFLSQKFLQRSVGEILKAKEKFGRGKLKEYVNIEFISANPTGPLTLANGRGGFYGDALYNVLQFAGAKAEKEYYINDAGNQMRTLGESILAAAGLAEKQEQHYQGGYIASYAKETYERLLETYIADPEELGKEVAHRILDREIKPPIKRAGISFDKWISEDGDIRGKGLVEKALKMLEKKGLTYEKEGAIWLKTSAFGDTEDRVLVKSIQKNYTYLASDIAYHLEKWKRGFTKLITIWGADHHGAVARLNAAMQMFGKPDVHIILMQLVRLMEDGKETRMSKRTGNFVTLSELFDDVGVDVARFFFLMREPNSHLDFDLAVAKEHSQKNPVYYVQYAHARLSNILKRAQERGDRKAKQDLKLLQKPEEFSLIKILLQFPELVEDIAQTYAVHRLPQYTMQLAAVFHRFYDTTRVIDVDRNVSMARLMLVQATKFVLTSTLKIMGISAPSHM